MIGLNFQVAKGNFFDRKKVTDATDRATRQTFSRFGRFTQRRAQTSMRRSKGVSRPGRPPHAHVGLLRKLLFFAYEPARKSVVIGPVLLRSGSRVPELHEYGGVAVLRNRDRNGQLRQGRYPARPYMQPAFEAELQKMPRMFKDTVKAA